MYNSSSNIPHETQSVGSRSEFATPLPLRNKIGTSNDMKPFGLSTLSTSITYRGRRRERRERREKRRGRVRQGSP